MLLAFQIKQKILLQEINCSFVTHNLYFFWESQETLQVLNSSMVYHYAPSK